MKLLVADDHGLVRETISAFIEAQEGANVVQASSLEEAIARVADSGPFDLVLLDYKMPGMDGLTGFERMLALCKRTCPVALMSGNISRATVEQAMTAGAAGFVPKTLASKSLLQAIRFMISGEKYVPFDFLRQPEMPADSQFSPREMRVLQGICEGKPNKVIAADLGLQEVTIKLHVKSVCRKLGARNRTHAAMIARDLRLI